MSVVSSFRSREDDEMFNRRRRKTSTTDGNELIGTTSRYRFRATAYCEHARRTAGIESSGRVKHIITYVSVEVISLVSNRCNVVCCLVCFLVEIRVDWWQSNHRCLATLNHRHPNNTTPQHNVPNRWVDVAGQLGLLFSNQCHHNNDGEDEQSERNDDTDPIKRRRDAKCFRVG